MARKPRTGLGMIPTYMALYDMELANGQKLSTGHILYMGAVTVHQQGEFGCVAKHETICKEIHRTKSYGDKVRAELINAGLLEVEKNRYGEIIYMESTLVIENCHARKVTKKSAEKAKSEDATTQHGVSDVNTQSTKKSIANRHLYRRPIDENIDSTTEEKTGVGEEILEESNINITRKHKQNAYGCSEIGTPIVLQTHGSSSNTKDFANDTFPNPVDFSVGRKLPTGSLEGGAAGAEDPQDEDEDEVDPLTAKLAGNVMYALTALDGDKKTLTVQGKHWNRWATKVNQARKVGKSTWLDIATEGGVIKLSPNQISVWPKAIEKDRLPTLYERMMYRGEGV